MQEAQNAVTDVQTTPAVASYLAAQELVNELPEGPAKEAEKEKLGSIIVPVAANNFDDAVTGGIKNIKLTQDVTSTSQVKPAPGVTIDGDEKKITFTTNTGTGENSAEGLFIADEGITIKNLTIENPAHGDNGIEIYKSTTLENVKVIGAKKAGIYVNHNGSGVITVNFKNVHTSGNQWGAGIGLVSQNLGSSVIANFTGTNTFGEAVQVYSEQGTATVANAYPGTVTVNKEGSAVVGSQNGNKTYQKAYTVNP